MTPVMTLVATLQAFGIATMFILWAPVAKISGLPSSWIVLLAIAGSTVGAGTPALWNIEGWHYSYVKFAALIFVLGVINGIGMYFYPVKLVDPSVPAVTFMTTVIVAMVIMTALFTSVLMWQVPSPRLLVGISLMIVGIVIAAG